MTKSEKFKKCTDRIHEIVTDNDDIGIDGINENIEFIRRTAKFLLAFADNQQRLVNILRD